MRIEYYYDFSNQMEKYFSGLTFDVDGIPMVNYGGKIGLRYNPVTIAQYSLANHSLYLQTKDERYLKIFSKCVNWFLMYVSDYKNNTIVWFYNFDLTECGLKAPWISAMAQGLAVSVLVRANKLFGIKDYVEIAEKAINVFDVPVSEGGVMSFFPDNGIVFEEYPTSFSNSVLNGFIFSILGLYDLYTFTENKKAEMLFNKAINSLRNNIERYDTNYWTRYDLRSDKRLSSIEYHILHIKLLDVLYEITRDTYFIELRNKWNGYYRSLFCKMHFGIIKFFQKIFKLKYF